MSRFLKAPFFFICASIFFIGTHAFSAVVTAKPSATTFINSASSKTWYDTSSSSYNFTPSKLTPISSLNKMTWYMAYLNYHNSKYPLSSAENVTADSSGNLYICWVNNADELNLSTNKSGEWVVEKIADDVYSCAHISVDSSDNIHMIYTYTSNHDDFSHITGVSHSWTITNLGEVTDASAPNFAVDSSGFVHMSYFDETNLNLKYATNKTGTFISQTIDNTYYSGYDSQIVVDSANIPHITYFDASTNLIKYATQSSGSWVTESIDGTAFSSSWTADSIDGTADEFQNDSSITVDTKGYAHTVYTGLNTDGNPAPKYATNKSGSWKKRNLEMQLVPWKYAEYDQFSNFSIALDSQENAHVSYRYEPIGGSTGKVPVLKYATNKDGAFKSYTVPDYSSYYFTKVIVTSSAASKVTTTTPIVSSVTSKTMTPIFFPTVVDQKVTIVTNDYDYDYSDKVASYDIIYVSTKEIEDTCSDFTLTLTDADCDGTDDSEDTDQLDSDGDGTVDSADPDYLDSDNDGTVDSQDAFPDDPTETQDSDDDGIGDNAEIDSDNDGTPDVSDAFPEDATETTDTDEDKIGNNADTDDDGDGFLDDADPNPTTFDADADHDGIPDCTDDDDDGDGISDSTDADSGED